MDIKIIVNNDTEYNGTFKDNRIEYIDDVKTIVDLDKKIITRENIEKIHAKNIYVATAIHKTYIDLNEVGTKAAAVTYFGIEKSNAALPEDEKKTINITFDKTFIYMIRDVKTKEMLFFGVVDAPNTWKGTTCSKK